MFNSNGKEEEKLEDQLSLPIAEPLSCVSNQEKEEPVEDESNEEVPTVKRNESDLTEDQVAAAPIEKATEIKEDPAKVTSCSNAASESSISSDTTTLDVVKPEPDKETAKLSENNSHDSNASLSNLPIVQASANSTPVSSVNNAFIKEQDMYSTIANMKQEPNAVPANSTQQQSYTTPKDVLFIKKEPGEDSLDNNNSNSNEPHDLKLKVEIKSESKINNSHEQINVSAKFEEQQQTTVGVKNTFEGQIKYAPNDAHSMKFAIDGDKYNDAMKYNVENHMMQNSMKYGPPPTESMKYGPDGPLKYDMKSFLESPAKYQDPNMKAYMESPHKMNDNLLKYQDGPTDMKYTPENPHKYVPPSPQLQQHPTQPQASSSGGTGTQQQPPSDVIKHESDQPMYTGSKHAFNESPHPHSVPSPYDPSAHAMKYSEHLQKYAGIPPPPDIKYRVPEIGGPPPANSKTQYSADNLIKNPMYSDQTSPLKYHEAHVDSSPRSTPNQDSLGSNASSNYPSSIHLHGNVSSPQTRLTSPQNQLPHLPQSQQVNPLILSHPGMPPLGPSGHLPSNHPLMMAHSSQSVSMMNVPPQQPQPTASLANTNNSSNTPSGSSNHQPLHRPHQLQHPVSLPPHPSSYAVGPPPSSHPSSSQSRSPALARNDSGDRDRDRSLDRRDPSSHHRRSPPPPSINGIIPGAPPGLLPHSALPLNLGSGAPNIPPVGMPLHLGPPLLSAPPTTAGTPTAPTAPLPLISSVSVNSLSSDDRRTPTSALSTTPTATSVASAFSRTSPSVQFTSLPPSSAHRTNSPSQPPNSITRGSPLHLPHHSASSLALSAAERDRQQAIIRQQSPHMTPPPVSSSLIASPLSKIYGQQQQQRSLGVSPPPHHLRPGTSPPVMRHPQMPLPLPLIGQAGSMPTPMGMHPSHNPYPHHLIHPMFYPHQPSPFNTPYPYHPYGPASFQYMARWPPPGSALESMAHHQSVASRCEEPPPPHGDKQMSSGNSQSAPHKVILYKLIVLIVFVYTKFGFAQ